MKYHGLKDKKRRIPFHDSISVCVDKLITKATIEFDKSYPQDIAEVNGNPASDEETARTYAVVSPLRALARTRDHFKLSTANSLTQGKGLGFSASAFASVALASSAALRLRLELERLSEIARLGAGSASRSLVGGFSIWYASRRGRSYARQLPSAMQNFAMAIVPVPSRVKTDMAHKESVGSPFFQARLSDVRARLPKMQRAIEEGDVDEVGRLAEADSLSLHAVTMTGKSRLILMAPETILVIKQIMAMREAERIPVWYSLDTGPSVYVNTQREFVDEVCSRIEKNTNLEVLKSDVGGPAYTTEEHLF